MVRETSLLWQACKDQAIIALFFLCSFSEKQELLSGTIYIIIKVQKLKLK